VEYLVHFRFVEEGRTIKTLVSDWCLPFISIELGSIDFLQRDERFVGLFVANWPALKTKKRGC
jgi:hypothetical protein